MPKSRSPEARGARREQAPKRRSVLVLALACAALVGWLGHWHLGGLSTTAQVGGWSLLAAYIAFVLSELGSAHREADAKARSRDRRTFELYAFARAATLVACFAWAPDSGHRASTFVAGLALLGLGAACRLSARRTLGRYYSHKVRIHDDHPVVDLGPYRRVRHPAYAGMLLVHAGLLAGFFNWVALATFALLFVPAVIVRIFVEERELFRIPGYLSYARERKRLVPGVW
jgi:protein-S-isoprenylcysteine O-methyltransferase Ste14